MVKFTKTEIEDIGKLFLTPLGEKVMTVLDREIYNTVSYIPGDDEATKFNEGHRDLVHFFHNALNSVKGE